MRFTELNVPAFGPFTDLHLKFHRQDHDFHLIYGPNEAGKSSLLRAIRDLLFGIHGQSTDNFLHDYKNLRLKGEIVNKNGDSLIFQRRKGNKNTLLDAEENPMSDQALQPFLGSVDLNYFSTMFGLGNKELREGAIELLKGKGEVGNALFSASLGGTPIQHIIGSIMADAERLYRGRATTNVTIRPASKYYRELLKQSRDAQVNPEKWDRLEKELKDKDASRENVEKQLAQMDNELSWISRCEDALPAIGGLNQVKDHLKELPDLPELAEDFKDRARQAQKEVKETQAKVQSQKSHLKSLNESLQECPSFPEILEAAHTLENIHQDLGAYRTRKKSLADLQAKLRSKEQTLQSGMKNLNVPGHIDSIETLRLESARRLVCEEAAAKLAKARKAYQEIESKSTQLTQNIDELERDLISMPEPDLVAVREALAEAAGATDAYNTLPHHLLEMDELQHQVADLHALVPGVPDDYDQTHGLPVPGQSTIRDFRSQLEKIQHGIELEQTKIRDEQTSIETNQSELLRLQRRGELPSLESLNQARQHRDHGWQLVLEAWKGQGTREELFHGVPLEDAYPEAVKKADNIADQLRFQAETVAQAEEKRGQIESSLKRIEHAEIRLDDLKERLKTCQSEWTQQWAPSGIEPRSPSEMEEWRDAWVCFREGYNQLKSIQRTVESKKKQVETAIEILSNVVDPGVTRLFPVLFESARRKVEEGEGMSGARKKTKQDLEKLTHRRDPLLKEQDSLVKALEVTENEWANACQLTGLPGGVTPDSGLQLLRERTELIEKWDEWKELSVEVRQLEDANLQYQIEVRDKALVLGVEGKEVEVMESDLWNALQKARQTQSRREHLQREIEVAESRLTKYQQLEAQALEVLEGLLSQAKLAKIEELEPLIANIERHKSILDQIHRYESTLSNLARGETVKDFIERVGKENSDEFHQRKDGLERAKSGCKSDLQILLDELANLKRQKQEMENAGGAAADFRQQAESVAASLTQDATRYIRLRLAAHYLQTQIERYRQENQGPLLEKSGQMFSRITRGAFAGLSAEFNDQDVPLLVGKRPDGSTVPIEGMSDGTRDQLFLSLRMAALDRYLVEHEPMPLILDDLLVTFDDERTQVILPELARLSRKTQVFLFTHHQHVVDLSQKELGDQLQLVKWSQWWNGG